MNYPANGIEKNNGVQRTSGQFKHAVWTWIVALVLAIYLFWQWQHGQGPASASACCIAISPNASTVANNAPANFHFTATAKDGYQATGDASNVVWATKSAALSAWLKGGEDWAVTGDAANIKLTGTVETQEIKQAKGTEAQAFFGTEVTVDNQLQVKTAETTPSEVAVQPR